MVMQLGMNLSEFLKSVDEAPETKGPDFWAEMECTLAVQCVFVPSDFIGISEIDAGNVFNNLGMKSVATKAARAANVAKVREHLPQAANASESMSVFVDSVQKVDPIVHVDVVKKLIGVSLSQIPTALHPRGEDTDELATEVAKFQKKKIAKPFVCVKLAKFLPGWCAVQSAECLSDQEEPDPENKKGFVSAVAKEMARNQQATSKNQRLLNTLEWNIAFDKYVIAAIATDQWSLGPAMAHKEICNKVAVRAGQSDPPRRHSLGIVYDQVCRKAWADKAYSGDDSFDRSITPLSLDNALLKDAESEWDLIFRRGKGPIAATCNDTNSDRPARTERKCYNCGNYGHIERECRVPKWNVEATGYGKRSGPPFKRHCGNNY